MTNDLYLAIEDDERIIDRLTEDEIPAEDLNDLDQWDAEGEAREDEHVLCGGCVFCMDN